MLQESIISPFLLLFFIKQQQTFKTFAVGKPRRGAGWRADRYVFPV